MMPEDEDKLLNGPEAARRLGVDPRTLHRWAAEGKIDCVQAHPTAHRRYRASDIDKIRHVRG